MTACHPTVGKSAPIMLTRETQKKLTNVSIVALRRFGRRFELAVYPNTLYEYRHNPSIPLTNILHSFQIYRSVVTGDLVSDKDLGLFNSPKEEIYRIILNEGHEQKPTTTSQHEITQIEKQIIELLKYKVTFNGSYVSGDLLLKSIKNVYDIKNMEPKKQMGAIIRRLEEIGYERVSFRVRCDEHLVEYEGVERGDGYVLVKSDVLPGFIEYCKEHKIPHVVERHETVEEEEIC